MFAKIMNSLFATLRTYVLCGIPWLRGQSLFAWQEGKKQSCHPSLDLQYGTKEGEGGKGKGGMGEGRPWMGSRPPSEGNQSLGGASPPQRPLQLFRALKFPFQSFQSPSNSESWCLVERLNHGPHMKRTRSQKMEEEKNSLIFLY